MTNHYQYSIKINEALAALRRIRPDETKPVSQREFMRAFVEQHCNVPLWYLCSECHRLYNQKR